MFMSLLYIFPRLLSSIICIFAIIRVQQAVNAFRSLPCRRRRFIFCLPDFCAGFPPLWRFKPEETAKARWQTQKRRKKRKKYIDKRKKMLYTVFTSAWGFVFAPKRRFAISSGARTWRPEQREVTIMEVPIKQWELRSPWSAVNASRETMTPLKTRRTTRTDLSWRNTADSAGSTLFTRKANKNA